MNHMVWNFSILSNIILHYIIFCFIAWYYPLFYCIILYDLYIYIISIYRTIYIYIFAEQSIFASAPRDFSKGRSKKRGYIYICIESCCQFYIYIQKYLNNLHTDMHDCIHWMSNIERSLFDQFLWIHGFKSQFWGPWWYEILVFRSSSPWSNSVNLHVFTIYILFHFHSMFHTISPLPSCHGVYHWLRICAQPFATGFPIE